jgi:hypothetical protein
MTDSSIGWWTARFADTRQLTLWHLVQSEIEDRLITKCGRQMHKRTERGHLLTATLPETACLRCRA